MWGRESTRTTWKTSSSVKLVTPKKKSTSTTQSQNEDDVVVSREPSIFQGPDVLEPLVGKCFQLMENQYEYSVCPFRNVTQAETHGTRSLYILGIWDRYEIKSSADILPELFYDNGTSCGHTTHRKSLVRMTCVDDESSGSIVVDLSSISNDEEEEEDEIILEEEEEEEITLEDESAECMEEEEMEEEGNVLETKIRNTRLVHVRETETCFYEFTLHTPFVCGLSFDMFPDGEILLEQVRMRESEEDDTEEPLSSSSSSHEITNEDIETSSAMVELFRVLDHDESNSIDLTEFMSLEDAFEAVPTLTLQKLDQVLTIVTNVQEQLLLQQE